MKLQLLIGIALVALIVVFAASYLKEFLVKTEGFDGTTPTCTYTAIAIPNAYIPNCSGTSSPFACNSYTNLSDAQAACNNDLGCKGITYNASGTGGVSGYSLRSGYIADPAAPVATTMTSLSGESSYVITNLLVCKPNWQNGPAWQLPVVSSNAAARAAAGPVTAGAAPSVPNTAVGGVVGTVVGAGGTGTGTVSVPGGTMVLTSATNTMWANSMASQPAPLQAGASVTAAGPGAGAGGV